MNTLTPRTDAVMHDQNRDGNDLPNLCRSLERELDAARKDAAELARLLEGCDPGVLGLAAMACNAGKITEQTNEGWHRVFIEIRAALALHHSLTKS